MTASMIATKLNLPRARPGIVPRPRLIAMMERTSTRLTLVSAPAGFGKTTMLTQWLGLVDDKPESGVAWLSLDTRDNEPHTFWSYVIAALSTVSREIVDEDLAPSHTAGPLPITTLLTGIVNAIGSSTTHVHLVLDDYHVIESQEVHQALAFLIEHAPPQLHLIVASRSDPPLPVARLRARGELVEIRAADLRFTPGEAESYYNDAMGLHLSDDEVSTLGERTEGWIAALQLAALSMQGRDDVSVFIRNFTGDDRYIVDYLVEEVLQHQPDHIERFLLETSILDRLSGPLCDAVTAGERSKTTLERLDRSNLFLVPLDDQRRWYRYHHLFADVLRARLHDEKPDALPTLHGRASEWFDAHGEPSAAIEHALAGSDFERAAELIEHEVSASRRDRREVVLLGWLEQLPDSLLEVRPVLNVAYAGTMLSNGIVEGVEQRLLGAEKWLADKPGDEQRMVVVDDDELRRLPGWLAIYRAAQALLVGNAQGTLTNASRALSLLDERDPFAKGAASALLGLASWRLGDLEEAYNAYATCSDLFRQDGYLADVVACSITLADIRITQGRLREAMGIYQRSLQVADREDGASSDRVVRGVADMYVGMSELHRERNDLSAAKDCLEISARFGEHRGLPQNPYRWRVAMARVKKVEGDLAAAETLIKDAEDVYVGDFSPEVRPLSAVKARLWVKTGQLDASFAWAAERDLSVEDDLSYLKEFEHVTFVRMLIARFTGEGRESDLTMASSLLERLLDVAESGGRGGSVLEVLVLQALTAKAAGDTAAALETLDRAVHLGAPEGNIRVFADEGSPMFDLLRALGPAAPTVDAYVKQLLRLDTPQMPNFPRNATKGATFVEPLSDRERDVLRLLGSELTGPDIARELVVSLSTVRTHTRSIYTKLGVSSRQAAVRRGDELDLLGTPRS